MILICYRKIITHKQGIFAGMMKERSSRPVAIWLMVGVGMVIVQVILGGITRLTGSGLSITEWDVITGTLPPLNEQQWLVQFHKYQQSPQYRLLNSEFTVGDFKFIFFWEWFHRLWGRLIGVVFAIPFIIFLVQGRFKKEMVRPLVILFFLGALQGAVGWIMVASGLTGDAIYVKPTRLAVHFVFALVLLAYTFWFTLKLIVKDKEIIRAPKQARFTWVLLGLLGVQLLFGALMAGHKAAPAAPTWPDINGSFVPAYALKQGLVGVIENPITIHLVHRMVAYLLTLLVIIWFISSFKIPASSLFKRARALVLFFVLLQVTLGVFTVLASVRIRVAKWNEFEWMALLHQFVALMLLLSLVFSRFLVRRERMAHG